MSGMRHSHGRRASRGVAMVAIVVLHALAVTLGLMIKGPRADEAQQPDPIVITMTTDSRSVAPPPAVKVRLEEVLPQPVTPAIQIMLPTEPPATAITLTTTPAPAPPAVEAQVRDGPVVVAEADYLRLPAVVYPAAAKRARAQGLVHVRALVDVEGRASEVSVARSSGFDLLDRAACDAVRGALFKPYRRNDVARSMVVIVPIDFNLKPSGGRARDQSRENLKLDVRGEHHHAMRGHAEELGSLGAASLHVGE